MLLSMFNCVYLGSTYGYDWPEQIFSFFFKLLIELMHLKIKHFDSSTLLPPWSPPPKKLDLDSG